MYFILTIVSSKKIYKIQFSSMNDAYYYYLHNFSTLKDWFIGLMFAHKLLCKIKDERLMWDIFDNVFDCQKVFLEVFTKPLDK